MLRQICPACGSTTAGEICDHHTRIADEWSGGNRVMCDLIHRGVVPARLPLWERIDIAPSTQGEDSP